MQIYKKNRTRLIAIFFFAIIVIPLGQSFAYSQNIGELWQQAEKAYTDKNYDLFLISMKKISQQRPYQINVQRNLIRAYSLTNQSDSALIEARRLADEGLFADFSAKDFDNLNAIPEFKPIKEKIKTNMQPQGKAETHLTIPEFGFLPESVAYHSRKKEFYISSVRQGKILRITSSGKTTTFIQATKENELKGILGIKIDKKNNVLWAVSSKVNDFPSINQDADFTSALYKFDLATGKLLKIFKADHGTNHFFGDLLIMPDGNILVSDSYNPVIYTTRKGDDKLHPLITSDEFSSLQGLCLMDNNLYISDYNSGLYSYKFADKKLEKLKHNNGINIGGIDGLYCYEKDLIAIQNGSIPHRIIKLTLKENIIEKLGILNQNLPEWDEPTLGIIIGSKFYYVATSQWGLYDKNGNMADETKQLPILIMKTALD